MTIMPPSPFLSDSAMSFPNPIADTAVALPTPPGAAAGPLEPPSNQGGSQGAPAIDAGSQVAGATDLLGSDISDVGEIFLFAKILCAQARLNPGTISPEALSVCEEIEAYEDVYYDPPPLFLRRA